MAPELLERLVNLTDIELFKRVDVYALALVYWEMANRCEAIEGNEITKSACIVICSFFNKLLKCFKNLFFEKLFFILVIFFV